MLIVEKMNNHVNALVEKQAAICRALGNPRRLLIIWMLSQAELSVNEITMRAGSSLQNISQHLSLLKELGLVTTRRDGQTIYYQIANDELAKRCISISQTIDTSHNSTQNSNINFKENKHE